MRQILQTGERVAAILVALVALLGLLVSFAVKLEGFETKDNVARLWAQHDSAIKQIDTKLDCLMLRDYLNITTEKCLKIIQKAKS